jgi:hypothetical protein
MPMPDPLPCEFPDFYLLRRAAETFGSVGRWSAGRGRPPQAAARRAGLEFVEKLLTANLTSTDTRSGTSACRSASRFIASLVELATGSSCASPWWSSPSPPQARPPLLGSCPSPRSHPSGDGTPTEPTPQSPHPRRRCRLPVLNRNAQGARGALRKAVEDIGVSTLTATACPGGRPVLAGDVAMSFDGSS